MVLYQFERALGHLVRDTPSDDPSAPIATAHQIAEREQARGNPIDPTDMDSVVAASYLEELVQLAAQRVEGSRRDAVERLQRLLGALEVHDIRNAIAHPNRPFPECYWHRMAALATDPLVGVLRLPGVSEAFRAAGAERIQAPPDQWLEEPTWALPNNLPSTFEHSVTGLIGRRDLARDVRALLEHPRVPLLAIVGPGGLGKTSIVLQVLDDIINDRRAANAFDRVVFVSSKVEILTPDGAVAVHAPDTVDALWRAVDEETDGALGEPHDGGERVLLCLDNVDTVLAEQADAFRTFYERLPHTWRVVVTSRVLVDGARTVQVGPLESRSATKLLHRYLRVKGASPIRDETLVQRTVQACEANPLAVRLCVDAYAAGRGLSDAIAQTMDRILEFSYKNLISTLSPVATEVLEYLFQLRASATRPEIVRGLSRQPDEISEALSSLYKTTLLLRDPDRTEDAYALSPSVRDLIIVHPMDPGVRQRVLKLMRRHVEHTRAIRRLQEHRGTTRLDWNYVPPTFSTELHAACFEADRALRGRTIDRARVYKCLRGLDTLLVTDPSNQTIRRFLAHGLFRLGDRARAIELLNGVFALDIPDDELDPGLLLILCTEARQDADYERAVEVGEILLDQGWGDPQHSTPEHAGRVVANALLPKIWLGEMASVVEATADWRNEPVLGATLAALHAGALRNSVELEYGHNFSAVVEGLVTASRTLDEAARHFGYSRLMIVEIPKLVQQLAYALRGSERVPDAALAAFADLVDRHLVDTCERNWTLSLGDVEVRRWLRTFAACGMPIENPVLRSIIEEGGGADPSEDVAQAAWLATEVYYRPAKSADGQHRKFFFTRDEQGMQYFVDFGSLDDAARIWEEVDLGDVVDVLPAPSRTPGSAWPVVRARRTRAAVAHGTPEASRASEARHQRALRKQGIRLVEPGLQTALLAGLVAVYGQGTPFDRDAYLRELHAHAHQEGLPSTLTDLRKVWNLVYRCRGFDRLESGQYCLTPTCRDVPGLHSRVADEVLRRLEAELGGAFEASVGRLLMGVS